MQAVRKFEGQPGAFEFKSVIAKCCFNAALMLNVADGNDADRRRRDACQKANRGQSELLMAAAQQADELLAALQHAHEALFWHDGLGFEMDGKTAEEAITGALRKAGMEQLDQSRSGASDEAE